MLVPGAEPTWSVAELHDAVNGLLGHAFGDEIWVEGELCNFTRSANGHVYFDLVDPDHAGPHQRPQLAVALFSRERMAVNRYLTRRGGSIRMGDGVRVRIRGRLAIYEARSTIQLRMSWIDPDHTLGVMGRERDQLLAALAADGSLARNGRIDLPAVPLHVGLVTSVGSAAHADALGELRASGLGFRVTVVDTRTQGPVAGSMVAAGIRAVDGTEVDVVLVVRGGGARTDLLAFDTEPVARAIAGASRPVFTGIGHEIDRTVADEVAHSSHKTPTAAAAAVVALVRRTSTELHDLRAQIDAATRGRLVRATDQLDRLSARAGRGAQRHLGRDAQLLDHLSGRIASGARRQLDEGHAELGRRRVRLAPVARRGLDTVDASLTSLTARVRAQDPEVLLARGWTITRDQRGRAIDLADPPAPGDRIVTTVAGGTVVAIVDEVTPTPTATTGDEEPS